MPLNNLIYLPGIIRHTVDNRVNANWLSPSNEYVCQQTVSSLIRTMACHRNHYLNQWWLNVSCCETFVRAASTRHDVIKWKLFFALLILCEGFSPVTGEFSLQRPVTRSFDVFFNLRLNGLVNDREAGDLIHHRPHYDVIVMHRFYPHKDKLQ